MQVLRRATQPCDVHVAQHSSQIPVYIFNLFESGPAEHELHESILHEVLSGLTLLIREAHGPREQTLIPLGEQLLTFLVGLGDYSALVQHFDLIVKVDSVMSVFRSHKLQRHREHRGRTESLRDSDYSSICVFSRGRSQKKYFG